jgi:hypothetical protein
VDALPIGHAAGAVGSSYSTTAAEAEAEAFLAERPHLTAAEAKEVVAVHRGLAP